MANLSTENLAEIETMLAGPEADPSVLQDFRQRFPGVSLTRCDPSDVDGEKPYKEFPRFTLYLVSAANHCVTITRDPEIATGIIVVQNRKKS
ncbi:hypothetical protein [Beijerinckia indica]|uniref:Uncharacterized protein n=1 Tax=Beijerinckia indica subsp. indica (strain ATCC 9039 / DSM 1715 / NCIMB 8712) TaxID=395963 RepID=B2IE34_BEII9|nr:hypothetical protein [Beijerinckia indica]ACB94058.1 conserved hypothetical protein [Beijerinckia indica subsp. indica ATCC 9039]